MPILQAPQLKSRLKSDNSKTSADVEQLNQHLSSEFTINEMDLHARMTANLGKKGLKVKRFYTEAGEDPYQGIKFEKRTTKIVNPDGSVVFEKNDIEVPETWSQVATDILAQKYLRKKGVPQFNADGTPKLDKDGKQVLGGENSIKDAAHRLAGTWRHWAEKYNYFDSEEDAQAFEDEVKYMIVQQIAVPNSPQWFNTGLHWAYGITGEAQGHYYVDPDTGKVEKSKDAYSRPQPHACFIQDVKDDLVNEGGIFDLVTREARLFKFGSGTGSNFSQVRGKGEPLSGGGVSSGLMSFLKVLDAGAGAIQSGGTTRRAAKMVILDADHPEIETFIDWKVKEEQKVADLVAGSHINHKYLKEIMELAEKGGIDPDKNRALKLSIIKAKNNYVSLNYIKRVLMLVENGMKASDFDFETFDTDFRSEAYTSVSGQNSNNSVRVTNEFLEAVTNDSTWNLINRVDGKVNKTLKARELWDKIKYAAWSCADPGIQYHTTVNEWNTVLNDGEIVGSNPCSEYMFLNETACNLYQINLIKFYDAETGEFNTEAYEQVVRLCTIILEVSVTMSQLPSKPMAIGTYKYRTLGLGYANLGTLLMQMGVPYDSEEGFAINAAVTAIMGGEAYATSAEMAKVLGTFERYEANKEHMLRVMRNHRRAIYSADDSEYEALTIKPMKFKSELVPANIVNAAKAAWDYALVLGQEYGYRNGHVTCLAPTGTSGLVMDCDTTGIEPDFALVKFKKLVGGGYFKIVNQSIEPALKKLGYPQDQIQAIIDYTVGKKSLVGAPGINPESLAAKGFTQKELGALETLMPSVFELKYAFNKWSLGEDFCIKTLGIDKARLDDPKFNMLKELGFTDKEIEAANEYVCGAMTIEGAPFLKQEHYAVFDTANKNGTKGKRYIAYSGHIKQMAAAQPYLSGAISKTINMPEEAVLEDIDTAYMDSWQLMLKATALYRDGSKLSQPLSTGGDNDSVYAKLFNFEEDEIDETKMTPEKVSEVIYKEVRKPYRRRMADERHSLTHKFEVAGHEGYITVGLYEDGQPGEIFITMNKEGSTLSGITNSLSLLMSISLQYGVPIETIVRKFSHVRFEPSGPTNNPEIPVAKSIIDYIARWLGLKFLPREKAMLYHTSELVERSYAEGGSNYTLTLPVAPQDKVIKTEGLIKFTTPTVVAEAEPIKEKEEDVVVYKTESKHEHSSYTAMQDAKPVSAGVADFAKMQQQMALKQNNEDAPMCTNCGSVTIRNGACYKCPDCGTTTGCS